MHSRWLMLLGVCATWTAGACTTTQEVVIGTAGVGTACALVSDCKAGLTCQNKICTPLPPIGTGHGRGEPCDTNHSCDAGLYCGGQGLCTIAPPAAAGGACVLKEDCEQGLVCSFAGQCTAPDPNRILPGLQDPNSPIACGATDCQRPYVCGFNSRCTTLPISGGVDCSRSDLEVGDFRFYFEVPASQDSNGEFYRLPYPNDIRTDADGHPNLQGFYSPGQILGIDVTGDYLNTIESDSTHFPVNGPVFIRASGHVDLSTLCLPLNSLYPAIPAADQINGLPEEAFDPNCTQPSIMLVNIDPNYATSTVPARRNQYGVAVPVEMSYGRTAGHYICQNWLGLAPRAGQPLNPNTTYALLVTSAIKATWGDAPIRDSDFSLMLASSAPTDPNRPELASAYKAMAPLRTYLASQPASFAASIMGGTVFTTDAPMHLAPAMHDAVYAQPQPTFDSNTTTVCDINPVSPCDDGFPLPNAPGANPNHVHMRGCPVVNPNYYVIQGRYGPNPIMQAGTRPYTSSTDGGGIVLDPNTKLPRAQGTESMCYALSVPKGRAMPAGGWPTIIYAHGTGGAFSTFLSDGTASIFGSQFAIISFDNVLHGWRQGNDPNRWSPDAKVPLLFFNIGNARASRDNIWQGTADLHTITRLIHTQTLATIHPALPSVRFDPNRVYFVGHSQGTVIAPPYLVTETNIQAAILAGAGAELPLSLLTKTQPINIAQLLGVFFGDRSVARVHPMMSMMASLFGSVDAIGYASSLVTSPYTHRTMPLFDVMGLLDSFAPDVTQQALALAANLPLTNGPLEPYDGMVVKLPPPTVQAGAAQYNSNGAYDGHFVMFKNPLAQAAVLDFLTQVSAGTPQINP